MVLAEVEGYVSDDTIVTSNTSTISIDLLAESVKRQRQVLWYAFFQSSKQNAIS